MHDKFYELMSVSHSSNSLLRIPKLLETITESNLMLIKNNKITEVNCKKLTKNILNT